MPMRRVDSGRSSPRALEFAPVRSGIALEVSVEHGHRAKAESLDVFHDEGLGLALLDNIQEREDKPAS